MSVYSKIIKRCPLNSEIPVTIEYHFRIPAKASKFRMPKEYKKKYYLLGKVFERVKLV